EKYMNQYLEDKQIDFEKVMAFFKNEISTIRTGRANTAVLDGVKVEAYGVLNPLNAVASIGVADSRNIIVSPFDRNVIKSVEKAIVDSNLGLGVINDGDKIRLTVPPLTEENRRELVKKLNEKMERVRINLRQAREGVKNVIEGAFEEKNISEDDKFRFIKELDEYSAKKNEELKEIRDKKEKDIMEI
ncbi:MAG: ribosome recycling factor, partial [Patescibacteria group bacterium]|nr:ribosome recycling factor [Patescibacteria group bacterium]